MQPSQLGRRPARLNQLSLAPVEQGRLNDEPQTGCVVDSNWGRGGGSVLCVTRSVPADLQVRLQVKVGRHREELEVFEWRKVALVDDRRTL